MITLSTCDRCFKTLTDGEHGVGVCPYEPRSRQVAIVTDDIPGGQTFENGFATPQTFYSKSAYYRALSELGCSIKEKFCPTPGTDKDPAGVQNSRNYVDPYTLANVTELLSRSKPRSADAVDLGKLLRGTFNIVGEKDAMAVVEGTNTKRMSRIGRRLKDGTRRGSLDTGRDGSGEGEGCHSDYPK